MGTVTVKMNRRPANSGDMTRLALPKSSETRVAISNNDGLDNATADGSRFPQLCGGSCGGCEGLRVAAVTAGCVWIPVEEIREFWGYGARPW